MVHCLMIEDDRNTVDFIKNIGYDFPDISFSNVEEDHESALNFIFKSAPGLIFINIQTVKINLLEFLFEAIQYCETKPSFVALSASTENAFDAFKYDFSDYLLKPLTELSVRKSLLKYQKNNAVKRSDTICLKSNKDYQYLNIDDILYLKADNNTTDFYMADGKVIGAYKTLKVFENLLPQTFLRIHKSYIINKNYISRVHYGKSVCFIDNKYKIPFTKTFIANIDMITKNLANNTIMTSN